jgi:HlyD family secretion protein
MVGRIRDTKAIQQYRQMKRTLWLSLTIALVAAVVGYYQLPSEIGKSLIGWFDSHEAISVKVVQVKRTSIQWKVRAIGKLQVVNELNVVSPVAGHVAEIRFKVGDSVAEGQVLATVRSTALLGRLKKIEAALQTANTDLREQEKQLAAAERALERARELRNLDLIASQDVREAEAATETARAHKGLAQARVAEHEANLQQTRYLLRLSNVVAPASGVVMRRLVESGAHVESSSPVLTIASVDPLKLIIDVSEKEAGLLHEGMTAQVRVDGLGSRVFDGQVAAVRAKSETTRAALAEIQLTNRSRLLNPGMSVEVTLMENSDALLVPQQAVFEKEGASTVHIIVNEKMELRAVTTGRRQNGMIEIKSGVGEGDWVVVSGQSLVKPNSRVRPVADKGP